MRYRFYTEHFLRYIFIGHYVPMNMVYFYCKLAPHPILKVFAELFTKSSRGGGRVALRKKRRFLFVSFFFCAFSVKRKSGRQILPHNAGGETPPLQSKEIKPRDASVILASILINPVGTGVAKRRERNE